MIARDVRPKPKPCLHTHVEVAEVLLIQPASCAKLGDHRFCARLVLSEERTVEVGPDAADWA